MRVHKAAAVAAAFFTVGLGSAAAAQDYPPDQTTPTTVATGGDSGATDGGAAPGELPATGSDNADVVKLASGAIVTGLGLVVAVRVRRQRAVAS